MQDDGLRRLANALDDVWDAAGRRFVTAEDTTDEERFVQYVDGQLNVAWPFDDDPAEVLAECDVSLPRGAFVIGWTPLGTALIAVGDLQRDEVVGLVDELLDVVLEVDDYAVRVEADR